MTDTSMRRTRRSRAVRLSLLGAAAFTVAACDDAQVAANVFPSVEACHDAAGRDPAWPTREDCNASFQQALAEHERAAPRYEEEALCEEEHGGACQAEPRPGGGSVFLPLMAGYMMGSMLGGAAGQGPRAQPIYRAAGGGYATASGAARFPSNLTSARMRPASFAAGEATSAARPMTRATVRSSGGFGAARTSAGPRVGVGG